MKWIACLSLLILSLFPSISAAAETAQARLYCLSVVLHQGTDGYGDLLNVNSVVGGGEDELMPWPQNPEITFPDVEGYGGNMGIYDANPLYLYWSYGSMSVSIPPFADANGNKFPDFFEVTQGVTNVTTVGSYTYFDQIEGHVSGQITAIWKRSAGSAKGTCSINLNDAYYDLPFLHAFEIREYTGTLSYTPATNAISGTLNLTQTGSATNTFKGPIQFVKSDSDHFNQLTNQPGILTDASQQLHYFTNHLFLRDINWPTNYAGYIQFDDDGDGSTFYPWALWVLSINDTNDSNHNGIPDFSDDPVPGSQPPRAPLLSLATGTNNLLLTIHGDVGHVHQIQQVSPLTSGAWQNAISITLTNDPQVVPVPFSGGASFWRVIAQ